MSDAKQAEAIDYAYSFDGATVKVWASGHIAIEVGGSVHVRGPKEWHSLAADSFRAPSETGTTTRLIEKVRGLASLRPNWDSYGAERFSAKTIALAVEMAEKLNDDWSVVPCADGPSVWFTRNNEDEIIEVHAHQGDEDG